MTQTLTLVLVVLSGPVLAGCLTSDPGAHLATAALAPNLPALAALGDERLVGPARVAGQAPLLWEGECGSAGCPPLAFDLAMRDAPAGLRLEASVRWDYRQDDFRRFAFDVALFERGGSRPLAEGAVELLATTLLWDGPRSGAYEVRLAPRWEGGGSEPFDAVVQLEPPRASLASTTDLLPNLVAVEPAHLRVEAPQMSLGIPPRVPVPSAVADGCIAEEAVEGGARRCLRFSSGVGNAGAGPLVAAMPVDDALAAVAGRGHWVQRILQTDGSERDVPAGVSRFHPTHGHFHYEGILEATIYAYDLDAGQRGDALTEGRKTGFCFEDWGLVELGLLGTTGPEHGCASFTVEELTAGALGVDWIEVGVSPNWFDVYRWVLPDQYVDVSDVGDGVYELVVVVDPDGTLVESDTTDNATSVLFRMTGDEVEVLGPPNEDPVHP